MSRIAYVDGSYRPHRDAAVHIEDRGYQFADGVYEVIAVRGGRLLDEDLHLARLRRSLAELRIEGAIADGPLGVVLREVARRNSIDNGIVYLQITRGISPRDHAFPKASRPVVVVTARRSRPPNPKLRDEGVAIITIADIRWQRCDIKSVALVANVLGKQQAREAGAYEAWQVDPLGRITEGTSTNAWIVTGDNLVVTRFVDTAILNGVTRQALISIIRREGYEFVERAFTVAEAKYAREAFLTSTTSDVLPVVSIDGDKVANGKPGPLSRKLRAAYEAHATGGVNALPAGLSRPRAIIFDWDNTLVDSWATIHDALNFLMAAMERPLWTIEETRERVRLSLREAFPAMFGERWQEAQRIYLDRFRAIHLERLTALPGREAMLRRLADDGHYLAVVSNKTGAVLRNEAAHLGWTPFFGAIVGAGDAHTDKPHRAPVELALSPSGIAPGPEVWFVGDTAIDMECGLAAGCVPVLLGVDGTTAEFSEFPPVLTIPDDEGLFRALRGLRSSTPRPSS